MEQSFSWEVNRSLHNKEIPRIWSYIISSPWPINGRCHKPD